MPDYLFDFLSGGLLGLGWLGMLLALLVFTQLTIFSVTLYLHRSQAHRGVDFHPLRQPFLPLLDLADHLDDHQGMGRHPSQAPRQGGNRRGSAQPGGQGHRQRVLARAWSCTAKHAHSAPTSSSTARARPTTGSNAACTPPHPLAGPTVLLFVHFALFGVPGIALWAIQMAWIPFWAAGVVNGLGHWWGYRNFESADTSTNLAPWGVWIGGEELHNNHHAFPSSARFSMRRWEVDIGWAMIKLLESAGLARVLRVAPSLDIRPNISVPDTDTLKALLAHRFLAMTDYQRNVLKPALKEEARLAGEKLRRLLPRRLRKGLADDGRWLQPDAREQLQHWVSQRPRIQALVEHRARLSALLEARTHDASERLKQLQAWCQEAEASGIRALQEYAARLQGYALVAH